MTLFGITIQRQSSPVRIVRGPELLSQDELTQAFGAPLSQPQMRAILQLLDTARDNADRMAAADPVNRAKYVGGAEQCRLLLDDIMNRHDLARQKFDREFRQNGQNFAG